MGFVLVKMFIDELKFDRKIVIPEKLRHGFCELGIRVKTSAGTFYPKWAPRSLTMGRSSTVNPGNWRVIGC